MIQETVNILKERIEKHALDVWIDGKWKEIPQATHVGYKRILPFPEISVDKFRIRVLASPANLKSSQVPAHYAQRIPP